MTDDKRETQPDTLSGPTTELTFLGPSHDGGRLLLAGPNGERFELPVDGRLVAVVSREHRDAPAKQSSSVRRMPSPREIQDRIRHGETIEDLAKSVDADAEEIARFANPVITERAHIATLARNSSVTTGSGYVELEEAVTARLRTRGIDVSSTLWDAWRRPDGKWAVVVAYPISQGTQVATFSFESADNSIEATDEQARWLLELAAEPAQPSPRTAPPQPTVTDSDRSQPPNTDRKGSSDNGRWDREHPAARAAQRRESHQASQNGNARSTDGEGAQQGDKGLRPDEKWEELLFGTHSDD